jgi:hypothetical protein
MLHPRFLVTTARAVSPSGYLFCSYERGVFEQLFRCNSKVRFPLNQSTVVCSPVYLDVRMRIELHNRQKAPFTGHLGLLKIQIDCSLPSARSIYVIEMLEREVDLVPDKAFSWHNA